MRRKVHAMTAAAFLVAATLTMGGNAQALTLKVQSSFTAGDFAYTRMTEYWAPKLKAMSGGDLEIEILPTKAVVPYRETPDAVALGILDGDMTAIAYFTGRNPAFAVLADLIAGYDTPDQQQSFCRLGGGKEELQKLWDKILPQKIHVVGCGPYTRESFLAAKPIRGVADLKGKKIRAPEGLASDVFRRAGATPVNIPFSEVYTGLEKGIVDAADASAYVNNDATGMHKIAPYPLFPGIHSQAGLQMTINAAKWKSMNEKQQTLFEVWYDAAFDDLRRIAHLEDLRLVKRDKAGGKIEVVNWPQAERDKFRAIAKESWDAFAKKSPEAQSVLNKHYEFMKLIGLL